MNKMSIILAFVPLLASCKLNLQNSYNEEIRSMYPAYYYEASMEGFSNLHEKKENYMRVIQSGYYEKYCFSSENYDPDYFSEIYEILKTSGEIKKRNMTQAPRKLSITKLGYFTKTKTDIIPAMSRHSTSMHMKNWDSMLSIWYTETMTTGFH